MAKSCGLEKNDNYVGSTWRNTGQHCHYHGSAQKCSYCPTLDNPTKLRANLCYSSGYTYALAGIVGRSPVKQVASSIKLSTTIARMPNLYVAGGTELQRDCHCSQIGHGILHSALGPITIHRIGDWPFDQVQQSTFNQKMVPRLPYKLGIPLCQTCDGMCPFQQWHRSEGGHYERNMTNISEQRTEFFWWDESIFNSWWNPFSGT